MAIDTTFDSSDVFRQYIARNATYALSLLKASSAQALPRKKLTVILQALQYTLSLENLWPASRELLLALAPQMELLDLRILWLPYLQEGLRQSLKLGDQEAELSLRYYLGNFLRESAAYDEAIEQYRRGMTLAAAQGNVNMEVRLLNRCAFALRRKGELQQAEQYANRALTLAESDPIERGYSNLVLGSIRYDQRQWDECLVFSYRARDIWLANDARRELAWAYTNLGVALWREGKLVEAQKNLEKGILHFDEIGDIVHQASAKLNLGAVLLEQGKPQEALSFLAEAEKIFHTIQDKLRMAMVANNLAHVYQAMENWEDAIDAFYQSISLWLEMGEMAKALNVLHSLVSLLIGLGQKNLAQKLLQEAREDLAAIEGDPDYERLTAEFRMLEFQLSSTADQPM